MQNTLIDNPFITIKGRTNFYDLNFISQVVNATFRDMRYRAPSQGLLSNAEDLVKLGNAMLYSDFISEEIKSKIFANVQLGTGIPAYISNGWVISEDRMGRKYYARTGDVTGGGASIIIYPDEKLVIAGAINLTSRAEDIPLFQIANIFLPQPQAEAEEK